MIKAIWFNNKQKGNEILQPDFFIPKTHFCLYAELEMLAFPILVNVSVWCAGENTFNKTYRIEDAESRTAFKFEIYAEQSTFILRDTADTLAADPDQIDVEIFARNGSYAKTILCEYATISGKITDFDSKPFPAAVVCNFCGFEGMETGMGVWSDLDGKYSITLPKAEYNSIFIDDNSYGKTSLEAWCTKMIVDQDEIHDFKIGNGEAYSLDVWSNNGGFPSLFVSFRPMVLSYAIKQSKQNIHVNNKSYSLIDMCPDIDINLVSVKINSHRANIISIQKIIETGQSGIAMPMYILQIERPVAVGKQTLVLEYNFIDANGDAVQFQGRTQFNYANVYGLMLR